MIASGAGMVPRLMIQGECITMIKSTRNTAMFHATEPAMRTLTEAELNIVSGGIWDNPYQDAANQRRAQENGKDGTFGGSLLDTYIDYNGGLPAPMLGAKGTPIF